MKLSDLSRRDYIAIEALGAVASFARHAPAAAKRAYDLSDAMLAQMGIRDHDMEELRERAATAERTLEILRPTKPEDFTVRIALDEIWLALGVNNQTAAMQKLRELVR